MGLVSGVGVNDADYSVHRSKKINGKWVKVWTCPFYRAWTSMLKRCYTPSYHKKRPTYINCSVHQDWLLFSNFKSWMETQDWEGRQLDKDILYPGNKVYSPKTCVFVDSHINGFFLDRGSDRGKWPIGVSLHKGRFDANCSDPFTKKRCFVGIFKTPAEAHMAWKAKKHEYACKLADLETDPRIQKALRERFL